MPDHWRMSTTAEPRHLPDPPRYDLWPATVRSAGRLHGTLVPCGPGVRGIGWPETPRVRAGALAGTLTRGQTATRMTAAWLWGAARDPGRPLSAHTRAGDWRSRADSVTVRTSEFRFAPGDVVQLGPCRVSTPARTILDLLYAPAPFGTAERVACRLLAHRVTGGLAAIQEHLHTHRRPYRREAVTRLASIFPAATPTQ